MGNNKLILLTGVVALLFSGCMKEETCPYGDTQKEEKLTFSLLIGDPEDVQTRSIALSNECSIDGVTVLSFDGDNNRYIAGEYIPASSGRISGNDGDPIRTVTTSLIAVRTSGRIVVLVNPTVEEIGLTQNMSVLNNINNHYPVANNDLLNASASENSGRKMPMSGFGIYNWQDVMQIHVRRSIAKVQLALSPDLAANDVTGKFNAANVKWGIHNVMKSEIGAGFFSSSGSCVVNQGIRPEDFFSDLLSRKVVGSSTSASETTYYMPEYPNATRAREVVVSPDIFHIDRTCMVVQIAGAGFYRLDFYDKTTKRFIDIRRNTHIVVTVNSVKSAGYSTAEEARSAPGSNIEYEIKITGDNDDVVVSNGQYAISLSNDVTEIYATDKEEVEIATGYIILPKELSSLPVGVPNTITMKGDSDATLLTTSLTTIDSPIRIRFNNRDVQTYTLTIRVGNIVKTMKIRRFRSFDAHYSYYQVVGELVGLNWTQPVDWIEVTSRPDSYYIRIDKENITPVRWVRADRGNNEIPSSESEIEAAPIFAPRHAEAYILLASGSRVKLIITQEGPEGVGWLGGEPDGGVETYYSKRLVAESVEENVSLKWYEQSGATGPLDQERGKANTLYLMGKPNPFYFEAAYNCWMKNDRNANGIVDPDEPVVWYLPAQNQLMGVWVAREGLMAPFEALNYWSSSESGANSGRSWFVNFQTGFTDSNDKTSSDFNVRCVRDL